MRIGVLKRQPTGRNVNTGAVKMNLKGGKPTFSAHSYSCPNTVSFIPLHNKTTAINKGEMLCVCFVACGGGEERD